MRFYPLLLLAVASIPASAALQAQTVWQPLLTIGQTRVWADSATWTRTSETTWSVRLRTVEARVDGKASDAATIHNMEINCPERLFRVRKTSFERRGTIAETLPDSLGTSSWARPHEDWLEDHVIRAVCESTQKG